MPEIDTTSSLRLAILMEMLEDVSRATDPNEAVDAFSSRFWKIRRVDKLIAVSRRNLPPGQYKITRRTQVVVKDGELMQERSSENPWRDWRQLPAYEGGFIGEVVAGGLPRLFLDHDFAKDPVIGEETAGMRSCMCVPTFDRGQTLNWTFQFAVDPRAFTLDDLEQSVLTGNLFGSMTRNLVALRENERLTEWLRRQFEEVARVQQALLPRELPKIEGVKFATSYLTSEQAGGDYYDFFELPGGQLGMIIADVSGHGPGAATVMAMLHAMLHAYPGTPETAGPADVIRWANQRLVLAGMDGSFVTAIVARYNPTTREMVFSNAGHPPPRLKDRRTGEVKSIAGESTFPLGITTEMNVPENRITLNGGQTLVFYTDGITETRDGTGAMFGEDGIDAALERCSGESDCIVDSIHRSLFEFTGERTRADDQTLVVMQIGE